LQTKFNKIIYSCF